MVSGVTSGLSRKSDVERRPPRRPGRPAGHGGQGLRLVRGFEGDPQERLAPAAAARTAARRSASVLPMPSSVIRSFGTPARRATAHSPRETTLAPKPCAATSATMAGHVVGLDRVLADPRVGERRPDRRRRAVQLGEVGDVGGRGVAAATALRADAIASERSGRWRPQSRTTSRTTVLTRLRTTAPTIAADDRVGRQEVGGKSPTVRSKPVGLGDEGGQQEQPGVDHEPDETHRHERRAGTPGSARSAR